MENGFLKDIYVYLYVHNIKKVNITMAVSYTKARSQLPGLIRQQRKSTKNLPHDPLI
jgi:hypothetical protein